MSGIVVLTSGSDYAGRVLLGLGVRGVHPKATIISPHAGSGPTTASDGLRRNASPRRFAAAVARRALKQFDENAGPAGFQREWRDFSERVEITPSVNDAATESLIREIAPEYLILAGAGIVKNNILSLPTHGTINVHPGLLPWIRGVHVVEHAIDRGVPVGVTAHYVNAGIDTGNVIHRELVSVHEGDTLSSLRRKASERCTELLIDLAHRAAIGDPPASRAQTTRYPYCKWLREPKLEEIRARVDEGLALELHDAWAAHFGSAVLPLDRDDAPPISMPPLEPKNTG